MTTTRSLADALARCLAGIATTAFLALVPAVAVSVPCVVLKGPTAALVSSGVELGSTASLPIVTSDETLP